MKNLLISNDNLLTTIAFAKTITEKTGGKFTSMSDLAALRVAHDQKKSIVWHRWFLSLNTIYFGTYQEKRLIVVADHFGPLNTEKRFLEWKESGEKDEGSIREKYGVKGCPKITQEEFNNLVEKKYGDVTLIDFDNYFLKHKATLHGYYITVDDALNDPLLEKLLGRDRESYEKFIEKCYSISKHNAEKKGKQKGAAEKILQLAIKDRHGIELFISYEKEKDFPTTPIALLLTLGTPTYYANHDLSVLTEIKTMKSLGYSQLILLNDEAAKVVIVEYNPQKQWEKCLITNEKEFKETFFSLKGNDQLFVEYPKNTGGSYMDTGEIMFPISDLKKIGEPTFFETDDCRFFLKYHIDEVKKIAPAGANAYHIVGGVSPGDRVKVPVQFYKVTPITEKRILRKKEVINDFNLLLQINGVELSKIS